MTIFVVCLTTVRNVDCHGLISNAHIVRPSVVAVIILLQGQSAGVCKWPIDTLLVGGPSTLRPCIWSISRSPLYVWIGNPAVASTPQDTGLIGESPVPSGSASSNWPTCNPDSSLAFSRLSLVTYWASRLSRNRLSLVSGRVGAE